MHRSTQTQNHRETTAPKALKNHKTPPATPHKKHMLDLPTTAVHIKHTNQNGQIYSRPFQIPNKCTANAMLIPVSALIVQLFLAGHRETHLQDDSFDRLKSR